MMEMMEMTMKSQPALIILYFALYLCIKAFFKIEL